MRDQWAARAPLTGIAAVVFFVIAFIVGGETPDFDASTKEILDFYGDDQTGQIISAIAAAYGSILLVFFAASLRSRLRVAEALSNLVLIGASLMALGLGLFSGLTFTLADLADSDHLDRIDPGTLQSLNALNSDLFIPLVIGTAIFLFAVALAVLATDVLPRWMGWVALALAVLSITPVGFFAFLGTGIWIVIAAVMLMQGGRPAAAATAPPGARPS